MLQTGTGPMFFSHDYVIIMHNKMELAKTLSPMFSYKEKYLDGLTKLPLSMTDMLAHEHGHVRYAYYKLDFYLHDANYIVE